MVSMVEDTTRSASVGIIRGKTGRECNFRMGTSRQQLRETYCEKDVRGGETSGKGVQRD